MTRLQEHPQEMSTRGIYKEGGGGVSRSEGAGELQHKTRPENTCGQKKRGREEKRRDEKRRREGVADTYRGHEHTHTSCSNLYVYDQEDLEDIWCGQGEAVCVLCD